MTSFILQKAGQSKLNSSQYVKDITMQNFVLDVVDASMQKLVLVDFWAPWCGPCQQLAPVLDKVIADYNGQIILAKVNVDKNKELSMQLRVQSIPTVLAFVQGQPADAFMGIVSEAKLRQFIDKFLVLYKMGPDGMEKLLKTADEVLSQGQCELSAAMYTQALEQDPENIQAIGGRALCYALMGQIAQAHDLIKSLTAEQKKDLVFNRIGSAIELYQEFLNVGSNEHENILEKMYVNALKEWKEHNIESSINILLDIISQDLEWSDQKARKVLLKIFDILGNQNSFTIKYRRKLSTVLFA